MSEAGQWRYRIEWNSAPTTWRERLAKRLRTFAGVVDGRSAITVSISTTPRISAKCAAQCVRKGFETTEALIRQECQDLAREALFRVEHAELFEESSDAAP